MSLSELHDTDAFVIDSVGVSTSLEKVAADLKLVVLDSIEDRGLSVVVDMI